VTRPDSDPLFDRDGAARAAAAVRPARRRIVDFALSRIRQSRALQVLGAAAFVEYGALATLHVFGPNRRMPFELVGWMFLCALGSWFFLLAWYPFLETLMGPDADDNPRNKNLGHVLEAVAMGCVAAVHAMLAVVLVWGAKGT
jgi:hypothetical protein